MQKVVMIRWIGSSTAHRTYPSGTKDSHFYKTWIETTEFKTLLLKHRYLELLEVDGVYVVRPIGDSRIYYEVVGDNEV